MTWTDLLKSEIETVYSTTEKLIDRVDASQLNWKPTTGNNWMTTGQLLMHIGTACGAGCRAFATGDWGLPPGMKFEDLKPEEMLPPAETMPAIENIEAARKLLHDDKAVALEFIAQAGEDALDNQRMAAPWEPGKVLPLGRHFLAMVQHLDRHKAQLFYYLKLQGKSVDTGDLWG